jgi:putative peptidoglycan lipid II flippase
MPHFLRRLWEGETHGIATGALIVSIASLASRLVGLFRDRLLASTFGAGHELDAYYAAFRLPDTLYNLIILGALSAGFVPIFTEYFERRGQAEAGKFASQVISIVGAVMMTLCLFLAIGAPWVVPFTTPGFQGATMALTISLSRIMFLSPFLLGLSAVMGGVLQARRRLFAFAFAPIFYNVGIIIGILVFARFWGIVGVAWGVALGAFLHLAAQTAVVKKLGLPRIPWPSLKPEGVRRILTMMIPRTAGLAVTQVNLIIILVLASSLQTGSVSVFNLANNLEGFPLGLIGVSFAVAAFPLLARAASREDKAEFSSVFTTTARRIWFFMIPLTALLLLLRAQIVRVVLGDGKFDWEDTIRTIDVFFWLAISLPMQGIIQLLARGFFAIQNTWTPFWISLLAEAVNLGCALLLRPWLGISGLAIAFSVSSCVNALGLLYLLHRKTHMLQGIKNLLFFFGQLFLATAALLVVGFGIRQWIGTVFAPLHSFWQVALQGALAGLVGCLGFAIVASLVKLPEWSAFWRSIMRRMHRA